MDSRQLTLSSPRAETDHLHTPDPPAWLQERVGGGGAISVLPIVVGYRTGRQSREALTWAVREASARGLPVVVLFAADYPGMASHDFGPSDLDPGALEAATEVTAQGLIEARGLNRRVAVAGLTLVTGATQSLVEASSQASLVVVGSRRRGPVIGAVLGSVSRSVAGRASCPVVVVPPGTAAKQAGPDWPVSVGTDGSWTSTLAVHHAAETAVRRAAPLHVIWCAGSGSPTTPSGDEARIVSDVACALRRRHPGLQLTTRVQSGSPEGALLEASERSGLVVVGSRGRGRLEQMLHGSVSAAVIRHAASPVMVVGAGSAMPA